MNETQDTLHKCNNYCNGAELVRKRNCFHKEKVTVLSDSAFFPELAQGLAAFKAASNWGNVAEYTICKKPTFLEKVGFYKW